MVKEPVPMYGDLYTYADYLRWEFEERLEILRGKIFWMSPGASKTHQSIVGKLHIKLFQSLGESNPCKVFLSPFDIRLIDKQKKSTKDEDITTVFQPDLCIICDKNKLDEQGCLGAPDFIIEILSPGNTKKEMGIKFDIYEENGVREYWVVNYQEEHILQFVRNDEKLISHKPLLENDVIQSAIFPDLQFRVDDLFQNL